MKSIEQLVPEIKAWLDAGIGEWGLAAAVFLVALGSFGLGRLSAIETVRPPVSIEQAPSLSQPRGMYLGGLIVAARTGSVYYFPWCTGAQKIAQANQVWFRSAAEARAAGYAPAKNCKGLE